MSTPTQHAPARVAVIGAGRMGAGIAHAFLVAGSIVQLHDVSEAATERGRSAVVASVRKAAERGFVEDADASLAALHPRIGLERIGEVDLVVEAVPESPDLKASVLATISSGVPASATIATNTSSISVSSLASFVAHPGRFLGMHFFNPVPVSRLVELVRADSTGDATLALAQGWVAALHKESIVVNDTPGFATSRLGVAIGLEAIRMLEDGVADAADIDRGMMLGYGFPMGPLRLTDVVGLDVRLGIAEYLESQLGARFAAPRRLREMVARGDLGRKTGRGFFDWPN